MAAAQGYERQVQKSYWAKLSASLTVEAMMLDSKASDLDKEERPEILSLLPTYDGKTVLELGAGIGRFTGELALKASQLLALDFIDGAIKKNESINGHHKNVKFQCADVTSPDLNIAEDSVDLIFSNWLLMYLSDTEVENLAERMVKWLKVGGYIFFRESCFHQSGDSKRKYNPSHYREPKFYEKVFKECHMSDASGDLFELSLASCKCIRAYVRNKKNPNQICWTWQKVKSQDDRGFQRFLDNDQMNKREREIEKKERVLAWTCYGRMKNEQKQAAESLFAAMDADNDHSISIDEFIDFLKYAGYQSEGLAQLFVVLDADRNGYLDFEELLMFVYMLKILESRAGNDAPRREPRPSDQTRHSKLEKWLKLFDTILQAFECALQVVQQFNCF